MDAAHLGRSEDHRIGLFPAHEIAHRGLIGQVQFGMGTGDDIRPLGLQAAQDRAPHHAAMSGDVVFHLPPPYASTETGAWKPCSRRSRWRRADCRSSATISAHISCAVISGTQPSFSFALVGSPSSVSTSAGRK